MVDLLQLSTCSDRPRTFHQPCLVDVAGNIDVLWLPALAAILARPVENVLLILPDLGWRAMLSFYGLPGLFGNLTRPVVYFTICLVLGGG